MCFENRKENRKGVYIQSQLACFSGCFWVSVAQFRCLSASRVSTLSCFLQLIGSPNSCLQLRYDDTNHWCLSCIWPQLYLFSLTWMGFTFVANISKLGHFTLKLIIPFLLKYQRFGHTGSTSYYGTTLS